MLPEKTVPSSPASCTCTSWLARYPAADLVNKTTTLVTLSGLSIILDGFNGLNVVA